MTLPLYFDYMATTPVDPRVAEKMAGYLTQGGVFGNPASNTHAFGWQARQAVEEARAHVAALIHAQPDEIVWTSGATEADNLALKGAAFFYQRKGKHIITCKTEHKAVLDTCRYLESQGFDVTYLTPQTNGLLSIETIESALRPDTILVSIMHVNNEMGVIQDIAAIGKLLQGRGIIFHVDAAQGAGKLAIDVNAYGVDLLSISAHKLYGPKGIGALYVRKQPRVRLEPLIHGGGHEQGLRSGTLATHQIVGMGEACRLAQQEMAGEHARVLALREKLWAGIQALPQVRLNGDSVQRVPGNLNVSFNYVDGEALTMALKDLAVSSGSACTSASLEPSYVLRAIGVDDELAHSAVRFGLGRFTTEADINTAIDIVTTQVNRLRAMSPLWALHQRQQQTNK